MSDARPSLFDDPHVVRFLAERLLDRAGDRGMSSDAMIAVALCYDGGLADDYDGPVPHDTADFGRCCEAFTLAPTLLRKRMLPVIAQWSADLLAKQRERETSRA